MKTSQFIWIIVATIVVTVAAIYQIVSENILSAAPPKTPVEASNSAPLPDPLELAIMPALAEHDPSVSSHDNPAIAALEKEQAALEQAPVEKDNSSLGDQPPLAAEPREQTPSKRDLSYLVYYVYAEIPPAEKPADIVLDSLRGISIGTPLEEIKRAADAFGLNFNFMKAVAKIESDFDPRQRTGSYIGLFQLNRYEFDKYGSGDILNPRDNSIAAAYKFLTEATLFEWDTHKKPTFSDLYLIHQQGWQGAAEHVSHPERMAWKSMCATDEGFEKGERWCKRAIWGNTLPAIKKIWKSVDNLTSGAFVNMWRQRVDTLYAHYSEAAAEK